MIPASAGACPRCAVRADVGCKHQRPTGDRPHSLKAQEEQAKRERWNGTTGNLNTRSGKGTNDHGGLSFHKDELARNLGRGAELLGLKLRRD